MTTDAFICDSQRAPFGCYGGSLFSVRTDDLAATLIQVLVARYPKVDCEELADVIYGCAEQADEDNRNVARMAALLGGLPVATAGATINRRCEPPAPPSGSDGHFNSAIALCGSESGSCGRAFHLLR